MPRDAKRKKERSEEACLKAAMEFARLVTHYIDYLVPDGESQAEIASAFHTLVDAVYERIDVLRRKENEK